MDCFPPLVFRMRWPRCKAVPKFDLPISLIILLLLFHFQEEFKFLHGEFNLVDFYESKLKGFVFHSSVWSKMWTEAQPSSIVFNIFLLRSTQHLMWVFRTLRSYAYHAVFWSFFSTSLCLMNEAPYMLTNLLTLSGNQARGLVQIANNLNPHTLIIES